MARRNQTTHRPRVSGWVERVERDSGTRYIARWRDADGRKKSATFDTEAEAWDHLWQRSREPVGLERSAAPTVGDACLTYLRRGEGRWSLTTRYNHAVLIESAILPALGATPLAELTPERVQAWVDEVERDGASPVQVRRVAKELRAVLDEAVRMGLLERNPASRLALPRVPPREMQTWTADEARAMLEAVADDPWWAAWYTLALTTGLRPGEQAVLRWADIDLGRRRLTIRRSLTRDEEGRWVEGRRTKTGRTRTVALAEPARLALERLGPSSGLVFHEDGRLVDRRTMQRRHARLCQRAGVPEIRLHDLRHTFATLLLEQGTNPKVVADALGHSSVAITLNVYSHVGEDLHRAAVDQVGALLNGKRDDDR